jgi:hypothetical protein
MANLPVQRHCPGKGARSNTDDLAGLGAGANHASRHVFRHLGAAGILFREESVVSALEFQGPGIGRVSAKNIFDMNGGGCVIASILGVSSQGEARGCQAGTGLGRLRFNARADFQRQSASDSIELQSVRYFVARLRARRVGKLLVQAGQVGLASGGWLW